MSALYQGSRFFVVEDHSSEWRGAPLKTRPQGAPLIKERLDSAMCAT